MFIYREKGVCLQKAFPSILQGVTTQRGTKQTKNEEAERRAIVDERKRAGGGRWERGTICRGKVKACRTLEKAEEKDNQKKKKSCNSPTA